VSPRAVAAALSVALVVAGVVSVLTGWVLVSNEDDVAVQTTYVVSAGLIGLALMGIGAVLLDVIVGRRLEVDRRRALARVLMALAGADER
jgi:uncharacterized membrane protein YphA (DoxX/SURF4 family)